MLKNQDIRKAVDEEGLKLYQVADKLNLNDGNFSRKLRNELSTEEKAKIYQIIKELKATSQNKKERPKL
jgi:hypothetical protein